MTYSNIDVRNIADDIVVVVQDGQGSYTFSVHEEEGFLEGSVAAADKKLADNGKLIRLVALT